jgi:hypothetical protein
MPQSDRFLLVRSSLVLCEHRYSNDSDLLHGSDPPSLQTGRTSGSIIRRESLAMLTDVVRNEALDCEVQITPNTAVLLSSFQSETETIGFHLGESTIV